MKYLLGLLLLSPAAGWACSCMQPVAQRTVVPADGQVDFPVDGVIRVFLTGGFPAALRARLGADYRLVGPTGPVPLAASVQRTRLDLAPQGGLAPRTRYVLEAAFAYGPDGRRLSDDERLRGEGDTEKRHWFPVVAFTTGEKSAPPPTPFGPLAEVRVDHRMGGGDCGPGTSLTARWPSKALGPFEVLALEVEGQGVVETAPEGYAPSPGQASLGAGNLLCDPDPFHLGDGPYRARVVVLGAGGQTAATPWVSAGSRRGPLAGFGRRSVTAGEPQGDPQSADFWFAVPVTDPPAQAPAGPPGCPHGLESTLAWEADATYTPRSYEAWPAVGPGPSTVVETEAGAQWVRVGDRPTRGPVLAGSLEAADLRTGAGVVLLARRAEEKTGLDLAGLGPDGATRWTLPLAKEHLNWRGRVAACGGHVLAAWQQVEGHAFEGARLVWVLADADGHEVARSAPEVIGMIEGMGLGCHGDGFAVVLPSAREQPGPTLRLIDTAGRVHVVALPELRGTTFTVAAWRGGSAIAATRRDGGVDVALLIPAGKVQRVVPVADQPGDRKPAVTAWADLVAVAWESWPGDRAWATVLDGEGRVAEPVALGRGADRMSVAIAPTEEGQLAVAVARGQGFEVESLRCRSAAGGGAPARMVVAPKAP